LRSQAVVDANQPAGLQRAQRLVDTLARQTHQVGQLLLGDAQHLAHPGVQHRVEQRGQVARHAGIGLVKPVNLARGNELAQPLVEQVQHKAVEANAVVQQLVEALQRYARHRAAAQGLDVVAIGLALDQRALAKPGPRRHAGEGDGRAVHRVVAHLEQTVDQPEPVAGRPADAAQQHAGLHIHHLDAGGHARAVIGREKAQPRHVGQFPPGGCPGPFAQRAEGCHQWGY